MPALRPLLYLDVDGPLLPFGDGLPPARGTDRFARLDRALGPGLSTLPAELVWATAWGPDANDEISPRLGLPDLPVVDWPPPSHAETLEDDWLGLHWKTRTLVAHAAGRPFLWIDDELTDADRQWVAGRHPAPARLYRVESARGLRVADLAELARWLQDLGLDPRR